MAETMKRPKSGSVLSRLEYLNRKMGNPRTTAKEMKLLEVRQKNLLEMMEDGMEEFNKGGAVRAMKNGGAVMKGRGPKFKGQS